jgi:hypothetical protein
MSLAHYFNGKADKRPRVRTSYCSTAAHPFTRKPRKCSRFCYLR